jgi:hypothetical protein
MTPDHYYSIIQYFHYPKILQVQKILFILKYWQVEKRLHLVRLTIL